jgi:M6 family metalloprotease-like protein
MTELAPGLPGDVSVGHASDVSVVHATDAVGHLAQILGDVISALPPVYYCTTGLDVSQIRGADIPPEVEERIYGPSHGNPSMATAAGYYNPSLPLVIIPVGWPDYPPNTALTADGIRDVFFGPRPEFGGAFGVRNHSLRAFYLANSYLQYNLVEGLIANWIQLNATWQSYYDASGVRDASRDPHLAQDALQAAQVDWSKYLGPGDVITPDRVQIVFITPYGGYGQPDASYGSSGAARPYPSPIHIQWQGKDIEFRDCWYCYIGCKQAIDPTRGTDDITFGGGLNVIAHEMNHSLFRLPDRYPSPDTVGDYDLMSNSSAEKYLTIYDRMKIGWIRPPILRLGTLGEACYAFRPSEAVPAALVLYADSAPDEYWILENRDARFDAFGFDSGLPDNGLAVWWVDANTGRIALVPSTNPSGKPLSNPTPSGPQLFKGSRFGPPVDFLLASEYGSGAIQVSRVSPAGNLMFAQV